MITIDLSNGIPEDFFQQLAAYPATESVSIEHADKYFEQIEAAVRKNKVCCTISLANHEHSKDQKNLDELIWSNQLAVASQDKVILAPTKSKKKAPKRTRPRPQAGQKKSAQIDVDVAFQTEVVQEVGVEQHVEESVEAEKIKPISFEEFSQLLAKDSSIATSKPERAQLWYRVLGMVAVYRNDADELVDASEDANTLKQPGLIFEKPLNKATLSASAIVIETKEHATIKGMSHAAAEIIAKAPQAYVDGIDRHHLPKGFRMVPNPENPDHMILDYKSTDAVLFDDFAVTPFQPKPLAPISQKQADVLISKASTNTAQLIQSAHKALMEKQYDRDDLQAFRQNLPFLLSLNFDGLQALFRLCHDTDTGHLNGHKLNYYIHNQAKLKAMTANAIEAAELGPQLKEIEAFCQYSATTKIDLNTDPAIATMPEETQDLIKALNQHYNFSHQQLASLWRVRATKGDAGLNQILNTLTELKPEDDKAITFFQHVPDLSVLQDKDKWTVAYRRVAAMNETQKAWWDALVGQHMSNTNQDDICELVKHFTNFSRHIQEVGLKFYQPVSFDSVRSMPIALSRMWAILDNCDHENLTEQWQCLSKLPLQASGAIRAIDDSSAKQPCAFVLPEMQLDATHYELGEQGKGYQTVDMPAEIIESDTAEAPEALSDEDEDSIGNLSSAIEDLSSSMVKDARKELGQAKMFRYLAWTQHKAPLSFYREALTHEDKILSHINWEDLMFTIAYSVLAGTTTGLFNSTITREQPERILADWQAILTNTKELKDFPKWLSFFKNHARLLTLGTIASMEVSPDMMQAKSIIRLYNRVFQGLKINLEWITDFQGKINSIMQPFMSLNTLIKEGDVDQTRAILGSIQFMTDFSLEELTDHLSEIRVLGEALHGLPISSKEQLTADSWKIGSFIEWLIDPQKHNKPSSGSIFDEIMADEYDVIEAAEGPNIALKNIKAPFLRLIALKSHFKISYDNIPNLALILPDIENPTALYALGLLAQMTNNEGLSIDDLFTFVKALPPAMENDPSNAIPQNYADLVASDEMVHTIDYKKVHALIKTQFGGHFSESFFRSLSDEALDKATVEKIKDAIKPGLARASCLKFFTRLPKDTHAEWVTNLLLLAKQMDEAHQEEFILALTNDKLFDIPDVDSLKEILRAFETNGDPSAWLFIIRTLNNSPNQDKAYAKQAALFWLTKFSPAFNNQQAFSSLPANLFEVVYQGFEKAHNSHDSTSNERASEHWIDFCQLLVVKPIARDSLVELVETLVNETGFQHETLEQLNHLFNHMSDQTALSLAIYFGEQDRHTVLTNLMRRLSLSDIKNNAESLSLVLTILQKQANAELPISKKDISILLDENNHDSLKTIFASVPYPTIEQAGQWIKADSVEEKLKAFQMKPCERDPRNGVHFDKGLELIAAMPKMRVTPREIRLLQEAAAQAREMDIQALQDALKKATKKPVDHIALTTLCAELLHRSMGRKGNSYEINTLQYIAIYRTLRDGNMGPLNGKLDSGEGKSRVFMILAGALQAQGKTGEFITRNMTLAKRDYTNYQSFFEVLGTKTSIIQSNSPDEAYQAGQIHFSDVSSYTLFINQQLSQGKDPRVEKKDRVLLLDESDQLFYDAFHNRYNVATSTVDPRNNVNWVYDQLIEFFQTEKHQNLYYDDVDGCTEAFRNFVANQVGEAQIRQLQAMTDQQIETWLDSAMEALELPYRDAFNLSPDEVMIVPGEGRQVYSRAIVVKDKREQPLSTYANGTQQCLHARLNWLRNHPDGSELSQDLQKCNQPFIIRPENEIVYFNTSKGFLDDYLQGEEEDAGATVISLTGTAGDALERAEVEAIFGMEFVDFPRFNQLQRKDLPLRLCANDKSHFSAIVEYIEEMREAGQPILLICENDIESAKMQAALAKVFDEADISRIHSGTKSKQETKHVNAKAGMPGHITVTTDMLGRGTDIKLTKEAKESGGLGVLMTYMPGSERDYFQAINRAGRYGCPGTSRMIINKQRLQNRLGHSLPWSFYTHTGIPERKAMAEQSRPEQRKRLVAYAISDMQRKLEQFYFASAFAKGLEGFESIPEETIVATQKSWSVFDKQARLLWDGYTHQVNELLAKKKIPEAKVETLLNEYGEKVKTLWKKTFPDIDLEAKACPKVAQVFSAINGTEPTLQKRRPVFDHYERAHDGFAARYDHWFAQTRAIFHGERRLFANTRSWLSGEGTIFANLKAWLRGDISLKEYLLPTPIDQSIDKIEKDIITLPSSGTNIPPIA